MRQAGVRILFDSSELTVVGIAEVFAKIPSVLKGMGILKKLLKIIRPDLLILIDFPDFNLHLAGIAKKLGIPVLYYISPQIWAWRQGRVKRIGKLVDHMAVILPFEEQFYKQHNVTVTFVGHPLLDANLPPTEPRPITTDKDRFIIGLVPGSRENEISRHLPVMLNAADILKERLKHVTFIISQANSIERKQIDAIVAGNRQWKNVEIVSDGVETVFERCDAIIAASGTVTLQAAIHGTPMVVIYKVSPLSYWLGRALIRVSNISLVNLVAGKQIVPELVQNEANPKNIATALEQIVNDPESLVDLQKQLFSLREGLGGRGASDRVAQIALEMLQG